MVIEKVIVSVIIAGIISQLTKILIFFFKHKLRLRWSDIVATGGFPSTHTALVASLAVAIFLEQKFSAIFAIALVLFAIVTTDALGVRRTVGEEADALNKLMKKSKVRILHMAHGHSPREVLAGILIGTIIPFIVYFLI